MTKEQGEGETISAIELMRPKDSSAEASRLRKECGERFFREHRNELVEVACPACGMEGDFVLRKFGFSHKRCRNCKTMYCSPRPTEKLLAEYYETSEATRYWTRLLVETDVSRKALQYGPRVQKIIEIIRASSTAAPNTMVDIGAGSGAFAVAMKRTNFCSKVIALDISKECVDTCKRQNLDTMLGDISSLPKHSADLLTLNDLFEHLFAPRDFLKASYEVLKPGGFISIATPNGNGFDFRIFNGDTVNVTPPEHLNYFNPDSIQSLMESTGFELISVQTPGILDVEIVRREFERNSKVLQKDQFVLSILRDGTKSLSDNFQKFLSENLLSSHMLVIGKKI